jgi:uncharacterized membrane protein YpjA
MRMPDRLAFLDAVAIVGRVALGLWAVLAGVLLGFGAVG